MQIHDLIQGSPEWQAYRAEHFNASDAPAMMGVSPYKSRTELLREKSTGMAKEVDVATQRLFDDGHRFEALARSLAEDIIGEDLYPVTGSNGIYSASFDGLTMAEDIAWEHKTLNDEIRAACSAEELGLHLRIQMEHQLMVCDAEKCLFLASQWDSAGELIESKHFWYESDAELREKIIAGWAQFAKDLANYQHVEVMPDAVAAPVKDLPALSIRVDGSLTLNHNLVIFGDKLNAFIADINTNPEDDQGFADAEAAIKVMERAETALAGAEASALAQVASVDDMVKTVAMYKELARKTRLMLEKMVKARKETIRIEIMQAGKDKCVEHITALNQRLGKPYMPVINADFAGVMKGKKNISSLRDAVDTELSRFKIEANAVADKIQANLTTLRELAADHAFLFADTAQIVQKETDDCTILIKLRIADHKEAEEKRLAAERARIAEEERIKAEAKVKADQAALEQQQRDSVRNQALLEAAQREREKPIAVVGLPASVLDLLPVGGPREAMSGSYESVATIPAVPVTAPTTPPTLRLGKISERLGFAVSADFLRELGFEPASRSQGAVLFHEQDFPFICCALIDHVDSVRDAHRMTEAA